MSSKIAPQRVSNKLRAPAAAEYLGMSPSTMAKYRMSGTGPVYAKAGLRIILYDIRDLDAWIDQRRRRSTSDDGGTV